jgi:hypothetical protein
MLDTKYVQGLLDRKLAEKEDRVRSGKFSPSMFGRCFRAQVWNRDNFPQSNEPDERTLRVFQAGHLFHEFVQGVLGHDNEVLVEIEDVKGFADVVTETEVIDLKSQHSKAFWYMEKGNYDIISEKVGNVLQCCFYAVVLNKPVFRLVYISKDDLCIKEYPFETDMFSAKVDTELKMLRSWWDTRADALPPAEPRAYNGKECQYCNWRDICGKIERVNNG